MIDISYRPYDPDTDESFIRSSYLRSYRSCDSNNRMDNDVYFYNYGKIISNLLSRCDTTIACDPVEDYHIYGFAIVEAIDDIPVVHYAYVKQPFRRFGICKEMIARAVGEQQTLVITHINRFTDLMMSKHDLRYNPFLRFHK